MKVGDKVEVWLTERGERRRYRGKIEMFGTNEGMFWLTLEGKEPLDYYMCHASMMTVIQEDPSNG